MISFIIISIPIPELHCEKWTDVPEARIIRMVYSFVLKEHSCSTLRFLGMTKWRLQHMALYGDLWRFIMELHFLVPFSGKTENIFNQVLSMRKLCESEFSKFIKLMTMRGLKMLFLKVRKEWFC